MNKTELRSDYESRGWAVQQVAGWENLGADGADTLYGVTAQSPSAEGKVPRTARVIVRVTDDGGPAEAARVGELWADPEADFQSALLAYVQGLEGLTVGSKGEMFAARVTNTDTLNELGTVTAYFNNAGVTLQETYIIKRRAGTFTPLLLSLAG